MLLEAKLDVFDRANRGRHQMDMSNYGEENIQPQASPLLQVFIGLIIALFFYMGLSLA